MESVVSPSPPPPPGVGVHVQAPKNTRKELPAIKVHDMHKVKVKRMRAIFDFNSEEEWALRFKKGDLIQIVEQQEPELDAKNSAAWWEGKIGERTGLFPTNYCEIIEIQKAPLIKMKTDSVHPSIRYLQDMCFLVKQSSQPAPLQVDTISDPHKNESGKDEFSSTTRPKPSTLRGTESKRKSVRTAVMMEELDQVSKKLEAETARRKKISDKMKNYKRKYRQLQSQQVGGVDAKKKEKQSRQDPEEKLEESIMTKKLEKNLKKEAKKRKKAEEDNVILQKKYEELQKEFSSRAGVETELQSVKEKLTTTEEDLKVMTTRVKPFKDGEDDVYKALLFTLSKEDMIKRLLSISFGESAVSNLDLHALSAVEKKIYRKSTSEIPTISREEKQINNEVQQLFLLPRSKSPTANREQNGKVDTQTKRDEPDTTVQQTTEKSGSVNGVSNVRKKFEGQKAFYRKELSEFREKGDGKGDRVLNTMQVFTQQNSVSNIQPQLPPMNSPKMTDLIKTFEQKATVAKVHKQLLTGGRRMSVYEVHADKI